MEHSHRPSTNRPAHAVPLNPLAPVPSNASTCHKPNDGRHGARMTESENVLPRMETDGEAPARLIPLRYGNQTYPSLIQPYLAEVPAHFDVKALKPCGADSLHTEYSSKPRRLDSPLLDGLDVIKQSHRKGVPALWTSEAWATQFAEFIHRLVGTNPPPSLIEIHPPFLGPDVSVDSFLSIYEVFESAILERYPNCHLMIENRSGTKDPRPFLLSTADSILQLGQALQARHLRLGLALDLAQMFTQQWGTKHLVGCNGLDLLQTLQPISDRIHSLHIWGRGAGGGAHGGNLEGLFNGSTCAKVDCLGLLRKMFSDGRPRYLVLEVRKAEHVQAILEDLREAGFSIEGCLS